MKIKPPSWQKKKNQSQRPSQVWKKGKETSPLDKGCCQGSEREFGTRNIVVAILERQSVTIGKNI